MTSQNLGQTPGPGTYDEIPNHPALAVVGENLLKAARIVAENRNRRAAEKAAREAA